MKIMERELEEMKGDVVSVMDVLYLITDNSWVRTFIDKESRNKKISNFREFNK